MPPKRGKTATRNNGRRYSETEKAVARQIVLAAGGVITDEIRIQVATALNLPTLSWDTLARWIKEPVEANREPSTSTESRDLNSSPVEKDETDYYKASAREIVEGTFRRYAKRANTQTAVEKTEAKDAAKVMVDMAKLMQLLDGLPTEIVGAADELKELAAFFREEGIEMSAAIRQWRERLQARKAETKVKQEGVSNG